MNFAIRATGGHVILIHVAKQNGYESCLLFSLKERGVKSVSKENARGMQDDAISRQAVIDEGMSYINGDCFCDKEDFAEYIEFIEQLPPIQPEPHWIPVTERLPAMGKSVLICDIDGDIYLGHRTQCGYYYPDFCGDRVKNVTAWCNLPEPYKEVSV